MNNWTEHQLLLDYAERQSEAAFAELVRRHVDLVYSAALRMVNDSHLAKDVTQSVFLALSQNARNLTHRSVLSGWLHRTTQNLASKIIRTDVRRRVREQEAAIMHELLSAEPDPSWDNIARHLDAALNQLSEPDRDALLLRYFERKSAREMAEQLGISDDAAQKRVNRAVERLRELFVKRGMSVSAGGLAAVISANAVQAAPVGLALTISAATAAAAIGGTSIATAATVTTTATKAIAMTALQKTVVTVTIAVLAGAGIYEAREASELRKQLRTLQQQQAPLTEKLEQLNQDYSAATNQLVALRDDNETLKQHSGELLRLRGEIGLLRAENEILTKAQAEKSETEVSNPLASGLGKLGDYLAADDAQDAGVETPEAFLQTFIWAVRENRIDRLEQIRAPLTGQSEPGDVVGQISKRHMETFSFIRKAFADAAGFRLSAKASEDGHRYDVRLDCVPIHKDPEINDFFLSFALEQEPTGWRFGSPR